MDQKYNIKIIYDTGDSFHSEYGVEDIVELNASLELAKENLNRIKDHYEYYQALDNQDGWRYRHGTPKEREKIDNIIKIAPEKPWFVKEYDFSLKLLVEDDEEKQKIGK
jgi:hypothetical protein